MIMNMGMLRNEIQHNDLSLRAIITINIIVIGIIAAAFTSIIIYMSFRQNIEDQFSKRVLNIITLAALEQQGDLHAELRIPGDKTSSAYNTLSQKNLDIIHSDPIIRAIYTMRQDEKKNIYFVVYIASKNLNEKGKANPTFGDVITNVSPTLKKEFESLSDAQIETNPHHDQSGNWISAYAPFYRDDNQTIEGVIGVDINKDEIIASESNLLILVLEIFVLISILLGILGWFISLYLTRPITDITKTIIEIANGNYNQYIIDTKPIKSYEINQLGQATNKLSAEINSSFSKLETGLSENKSKLEQYKKEFETINKQTNKYTDQLKTLGSLAHLILSTQNLDKILPRITAVISDELPFYHVAIFLLDSAKEYAVLTATNSVGGQKMLQRNHRLKVGEDGIVGYVAGRARPYLTPDTNKDTIFLANPDLPETHSELAMPLKIGLDVIGILDIQSREFSAFAEEDLEFFSTLADYISIALQNGKQFQEIQKTITESDTLYRNYLRQEWKSFTNQRRNPGYLYNISGSRPITKKMETIKIQQAIQSGKPTISEEKNQSHLSVPIKLRGQVIGILNIQSGSTHAWEEDEIDIATAVADRVGLAIENARLLEDSQSRAARERTISEITSKIGASINIRNVLQTAVEELGHILPGSDVIIQINDTKNSE